MTAYEQATATTGTPTDRPVTETAKSQAAQVGGTAKDQAGAVAGSATQAASEVADSAKEQVAQVAGEAKNQIGALTSQAKQQVTEQASAQTQKAAQTARSFADQLQAMARGESSEGMATDVVRNISEKVQQIADRLENTEPQELLQDVRRFARNKPGTFLIGALAAGFVGGRLMKGATSDSDDQDLYAGSNTGGRYASSGTYTTPGVTGTSPYGSGFGGTAGGVPTSGLESPTTGVGYPATTGAETYPEEPRQSSGLGGAI